MTVEALMRVRTWLVLALVFTVPSLFLRVTADPFDLIKGTTLWVGGVALLAVLIVEMFTRPSWPNRSFTIPAGTLLVAGVISTAFSLNPVVSLFGQTQRYTGLLTIAFGLLVAFVLASSKTERGLVSVVTAHLLVVIPLLFYGILQETLNDPFEWSSTSFSKFVFSTMGNPNTATAWLGTTSCLLFAAYLATDREKRIQRLLISVSLGLCGPMISSFNSFQGQMAVIFVGLVLVLWLVSGRRSLLDVATATTIALVMVGSAQLSVSRALYLGSVMAVVALAIVGTFVNQFDSRTISFAALSRRARWLAIIGSAFFVAIGGIVFRSRLLDGLRGGFLERGDFFRSARDIFFSNPVFGTGLETFGFYFTEYRPSGHAIRLENSRTSSAHNIFLGMFANGGVILGIAYLALIIMTLVVGVRVIRRQRATNTLFNGVFASFLSFQFVSIVSVEHVALFLLNFVMIGLIFGWSRISQPVEQVVDTPRPRQRRKNSRHVQNLSSASIVVACLMVPIVIVGWWQVTRPARAAVQSFDGLQLYYQSGNPAVALEYFERATEIYPAEVQNWLYLAELTAGAGDLEAAGNAAREVVSRSNYSGAASGSMARILYNAGAVDESLMVSREALLRDPYSETLKKELAEMLVFGAQYYSSNGDNERARSLLDETFALLPDYQIDGIDSLIDAVGYQR